MIFKNGLRQTVNYNVRVVGKERVSVPAGTFDTFHVEAKGSGSLGGYLTFNLWVAPDKVNGPVIQQRIHRDRSGKITDADRRELVDSNVNSEPFLSDEKFTPGIFLEPEDRTVLQEGIIFRPIFSRGIELTKMSEGFVSHPYHDAARYCTIAYGHLIRKSPCDGTEPDEFRQGVSKLRGTELLIKDMEKAQRIVSANVSVNLTDGQYAALCDFVYNVGGGNFKKSTLLKVINAGQHERVPGQFQRWITAGGKPWPGLIKRRDREIALFFVGIPKTRALPPPDEDLSPIDIKNGE
jgi:GH24 family phage-related lysozyme (muramidase)